MEWIEGKPEQEGWYWLRIAGYSLIGGTENDYTSCNFIRGTDDGFEITIDCDGYEWEATIYYDDIKAYMGPLEVPEPPQLKAVK